MKKPWQPPTITPHELARYTPPGDEYDIDTTCDICGAVVPTNTHPIHDTWHRQHDAHHTRLAPLWPDL